MITKIIFYNVIIAFSCFFNIACAKEIGNEANNKRHLVIYSHAEFSRDWTEQSHQIKNIFEEKCGCKVDFVSFESSGALVSALMLEGKKSKADIILGIDMNLMNKAEATGLIAAHNTDLSSLSMPIKWESKFFIPYDYGYFSFVYNDLKLKSPPKSFDELINYPGDLKIIIEDPRSDTTGLGLLLWMKKIYGDEAQEKWKKLFQKIITVTISWGESYALFLKGEADMVFSYSTSPAYHMMAERTANIKAAEFSEGHFLQIEVLGKLKLSPNPDLADMFMNFLLSNEAQTLIPKMHFMYPVIDIGHNLPIEYNSLITPKKVLYFEPGIVQKNKNIWLNEYLKSAIHYMN